MEYSIIMMLKHVNKGVIFMDKKLVLKIKTLGRLHITDWENEFPQENEFPYYDFSEEFSEEIELLYKTIDQLPEKCRKVFLLACLNDKTYQEIADEQGTSVNTVKTQMKAALKFLRENLQAENFLSILFFLTKKI